MIPHPAGAFLIPYVIMLAITGLPMFYFEMCLGQFANLGPISVWRLSPLFKGKRKLDFLPSASLACDFLLPPRALFLSLFLLLSSPTNSAGIGWAMVFISALVAIYYNVIIGWAIYYLFASFTIKLPWNDCLNAYNDVRCRQFGVKNVTNETNVPGNSRYNRKYDTLNK